MAGKVGDQRSYAATCKQIRDLVLIFFLRFKRSMSFIDEEFINSYDFGPNRKQFFKIQRTPQNKRVTPPAQNKNNPIVNSDVTARLMVHWLQFIRL